MNTNDNMLDHPSDESYDDDIKPWGTTEQKIEATMKFKEIIEGPPKFCCVDEKPTRIRWYIKGKLVEEK